MWESISLALLILFSEPLYASSPSPIEIVESVPLETTLAVPGIRDTQTVWLEMINSAKTSLDFEEFYVSDQAGESLSPVLQAIQQAASRGVQIRFLADSKFYSTYPDSLNQMSQVPNIQVQTIDFSSLGGVQHSKYFVVDGRESFVGSQNFDWRSLSHIHEVGLRVSDPTIAANLELIFNHDWGNGTAVTPQSFSFHFLGEVPSQVLQVVASPESQNPSGIPDTGSALVDMINSAQQSVQVQVMEYTTKVYHGGSWHLLDDALRNAANRGVHVQLLVDSSDIKKGQADLKALARLSGFEVRYATIPQWSGGPIPFARLIHSKYMVVDGTSGWVGSENWSEGYFMNTRDVGLMVHTADVAGQLGQIFNQVWQSGYTTSVH